MGRSAEIKVRVSPGEKAAIEGLARAAGLKLSDFVRSVALGQASVGGARSGGAGTPSPGTVPPSLPAAPAEVPRPLREPLPPQGEKGLFWCETPLCLFRARSARPCPVHGGLTKRGFDG